MEVSYNKPYGIDEPLPSSVQKILKFGGKFALEEVGPIELLSEAVEGLTGKWSRE